MLCAWRITHLIIAEDGPWELIIRVRKIVSNGFAGTLLECFYCLSLWVSAPISSTSESGASSFRGRLQANAIDLKRTVSSL